MSNTIIVWWDWKLFDLWITISLVSLIVNLCSNWQNKTFSFHVLSGLSSLSLNSRSIENVFRSIICNLSGFFSEHKLIYAILCLTLWVNTIEVLVHLLKEPLEYRMCKVLLDVLKFYDCIHTKALLLKRKFFQNFIQNLIQINIFLEKLNKFISILLIEINYLFSFDY
jgi:hypothetical protein